MDLKTIRTKLIGSKDERAVSPVIGVILMVAITVILAAVIAAFVLDIGDVDDSAPNAQYDWESDDNNTAVTWSHQSGDDIDLNTLEVSITANVSGGSDDTQTVTEELSGDEFTAGNDVEFSASGGDISLDGAVDASTITFDGTIEDIEEVVITWQSDSSSTIIADHEL